ncbi:uncharacterized protein LOC143607715 [Bidens hawaiensis]|uniref:uncharacterized protein LOC143607715 n=1 Tax=Bidens hawaiensis TaxID=980011 RepID=UPI0040499878
MICDEHNHPPVQHMEGHPYAKRLTDDEFSLVAELTRMNVAPRDILSILKERNLSNASTISTIYNARTKIRMSEQAGNSPMQVLMSILHSNGYVYEFTTTGSNELENLFFVHPISFDIWRAFPHVLIIDATYKTNSYNMPFVQIVGVTSTNKTFSIAFAFMQNEKIESYTWVLNCLKLTLDKCMHPRVILTDRELALVNACKEVFPNATQLLCRWHISRNIFKNCRQSIRSARDWDNFLKLWELLEDSTTLVSYTDNYKQLQSFLIKYPRVLKYVNENWLNKYKEMFVSVWIDQHLNFGNNTTNRVESQDASQHTSIKESFEKSRVVRIHQHNIRCFKLLRGFVSNEALDIILADHESWKNLQVDSSNCGCRLRNSCGLPCAANFQCQCISLDSIDIFWRKLDFVPSTTVQDDDVSSENELKHFKENFNKQSKAGKKSWLRKLKDIIGLGTTDIQEPQIQKNTRGRPNLKKSQQKNVSVKNVKGDGNCGFRAIAVCLGLDEEKSYEYIRQQMREELQNRYDIYKDMFVRDVNSLYHDLCFFGSPCPEEHWMKMPEAGVLIANRFGVIIHSLSMSGSTTIFPFWSGPEESQHHRALTIALVFGETHYVMVELQGESPMPVITPYWNLNNISRSAVRWETMYKSRLELYSQLYRPESGFVDLSD